MAKSRRPKPKSRQTVANRPGYSPKCRQCGYVFVEPLSHCPVCNRRSGIQELGRLGARPLIDSDPIPETLMTTTEEIDIDDVKLLPPVERPIEQPKLEDYLGASYERDFLRSDDQQAPVARNVTIGSMLGGMTVLAVCMAIMRLNVYVGAPCLLIFAPAYLRTLSAIWYFRQQGDDQLTWRESISAYITSAILALMALPAGGLAFGIAGGIVVAVQSAMFGTAANHVPAIVVGLGAAFILQTLIIHRVWPVHQQ